MGQPHAALAGMMMAALGGCAAPATATGPLEGDDDAAATPPPAPAAARDASGAGGTAGAGGASPAPDAAPDRAPPDAAAARADAAAPPSAAPAVHVLTHKYDNARTGWNRDETALTPATVTPATFGKLYGLKADGDMYGQPLYVSGLEIGGRPRNVVFFGTMSNRFYAYDADAKDAAPLWTIQLGPTPGVPMNAAGYLGSMSTGAIDLPARKLYLTAKSYENGAAKWRLHALDIVTGLESPGSPADIAGDVAGTGAGAAGGRVKFEVAAQQNRPGLLLQGGIVYLGFGSYFDMGTWHGWVMGYDAATLKQTCIFNTTPNADGGAVWMSGNGLAGDGTNVYFATGNGHARPDPAAPQLAEALVKLDRGCQLADWHIRGNYAQLDGADMDYGSAGPLVLPGTNLLAMAGKDKLAFLYDRGALGKYRADDGNVVQKWVGKGTSFGGFHMGGLVYWEGPMGPMIYGWPGDGFDGSSGKLLGFRFDPAAGKVDETPVVVGPHVATTHFSSGMMVLSSNGARDGILWLNSPNGEANGAPGRLRVYDAMKGTLLWESTANKARDDLGRFAKFAWPIVVNGKVYVPTLSGALQVYGLLP